ncbi:MAG TPA: hypothetical protein VJK52_02450 [Candidatus Nanoarchaeia archaeon]|nr:hypothetical protein [Candidatus Nanoarchaeia archaeon]
MHPPANLHLKPSHRYPVSLDYLRGDVTRFSLDELTEYVTRAFTGKPDLDFLPKQFWYDPFAMPDSWGSAPQYPSDFFSELYVALPQWSISRDWKPLNLDTGYRDRLEGTMCRIATSCLEGDQSPDKDHLRLVFFTNYTVHTIWFCDGKNSPEQQVAAALRAKGSMNMQELGAAMAAATKPPSPKEMYRLARELRLDRRYRQACAPGADCP